MVIILFGVSGAGKTFIGQLLARELGWSFYDADAFHPPANVAKMRDGIALTDGDREPWLEVVRAQIAQCVERREDAVVACSALKQAYRERLQVGDAVRFVFLEADEQLIEERLARRRGHFMNPLLARTQFEALEHPRRDAALVVDARHPPAAIVRLIKTGLALERS